MDDREKCLDNFAEGDTECDVRYDPSDLIIVRSGQHQAKRRHH